MAPAAVGDLGHMTSGAHMRLFAHIGSAPSASTSKGAWSVSALASTASGRAFSKAGHAERKNGTSMAVGAPFILLFSVGQIGPFLGKRENGPFFFRPLLLCGMANLRRGAARQRCPRLTPAAARQVILWVVRLQRRRMVLLMVAFRILLCGRPWRLAGEVQYVDCSTSPLAITPFAQLYVLARSCCSLR